MLATGQMVVDLMERLAPPRYAMEGDAGRIGLQVGTTNRQVKRLMVTLDLLEPVVEEAIEKEVDFIVAHHALIFRRLRKVLTDSAQGRILEKCLRHGISVYVAHTNLDVAPGGLNHWLAEALGLEKTEVLIPLGEESLKKLVVFVPHDHVDQLRDALSAAGAGHIGNYSHCTFGTPGEGTFLPLEGANPYIGQQHRLEKVPEMRLETIFPASIQSRVLSALLEAHPYEEPAFDIYPVEQPGPAYGLGCKGELPEGMSMSSFVEWVAQRLNVQGLRWVGDGSRMVKRVGVIGGDGNSFVSQAARRGIDVLVTGDLYYHTAHEALDLGLAVVDPGHHMESIMKERVATYLQQALKEQGFRTEVIHSRLSTDPFRFYVPGVST